MQFLQDYTQLAHRAFQNTVFNHERFGAGWLADYDSKLSGYVDRLRSLGIYEETITRFIAGYKKRVSAFFGAESRCASSFITGPANFPVQQQRKRHEVARQRMNEVTEYADRVMASLERAAKRQQIRESGITPLMEAQRKLNRRQRDQEQMKQTNAVIRKYKTDDDRTLALLELGYSPQSVSQLLKPDFAGRIGFPRYALTNNNAEITRLKKRVEELKQKEYRAETVGQTNYPFVGGQVVLDYEDDRLRIIHDEKPGPEAIAELKRSGFRWSPSNKAWQRQLTPNARWVAGRITGIKL